MKKLTLFLLLLTAIVSFNVSATAFAGENAICYNCPPMWADWASQLKAIEKHVDIKLDLQS
jgi:putative spermidine/putrescine transport system substrate-binding protein